MGGRPINIYCFYSFRGLKTGPFAQVDVAPGAGLYPGILDDFKVGLQVWIDTGVIVDFDGE